MASALETRFLGILLLACLASAASTKNWNGSFITYVSLAVQRAVPTLKPDIELSTLIFTEPRDAVVEERVNNTRNAYSEFYESAKIWTRGVYGLFSAFAGIIGNILALVILLQRSFQLFSKPYLIWLAVSDLCSLLVMIPNFVSPFVSVADSKGFQVFFEYFVAYGIPTNRVLYTASVWIVVCFTIERFIFLCYPLKARQLLRAGRSCKIIAVIFIFSLILNLPRYFLRSVEQRTDSRTNETSARAEPTELAKSRLFSAFNFIVLIAFQVLFPFLILTVLNIIIVVKLRRMKRHRRWMTTESGENRMREGQIIRLLMGIVVLFFVCHFGAVGSCVVIIVFSYKIVFNPVFKSYTLFSDAFVLTNSWLNFFVYLSCSSQFRSAVKALLCSRWKGQLSMKTSGTALTSLSLSNSKSC